MSGTREWAMRMVAAMLIVAQALAPAAAWAQTTRAAPPAPPSASPSPSPPAAKGPAPVAPAAASPTKGPAVDRRLALVVGNNNYKNAPLVNPINDARLVAKTLEGLGFEVILRENLNLRDFKAVMRQFASRLENEEGTALLYYAGHGVQIEGRNFLLPIDVATGDEYEVRDESVDLEDTLMSRLVRARKREKIIILDACRDNPFRAPNQKNRALLARGFAQMGSEKGSLIVYSTSPGNTAEDGTGKNSVFTEYFVGEIQKDGVEIGQALRTVTGAVVTATKGRQTPWYNSSLLGEFYFRPIDVRLEEERRKKEVQQQVEAALKSAREDLKRDETGRISAALAERERERERERQERERQYNAQLAEFKALLERRDKELENARMQVVTAAKTRDEQLAVLASVEAERRQVERESPATTDTNRAPPPAREPVGDAAKKQADAERAAREHGERAGREERERLANEKAKRAREEADRLVREAQTKERLAKIEEEVRRKASLEFEMLNRKAMLPPELASLTVVEPQKTVVAGSNGDFVVRGVRLPADVAVQPATPNALARCAAFLGAWGGGRWNGERTAEIWVESVDADCRARVTYARGGNSLSGEPPSHQRGDARISDDRLTLDLGAVRIELTRDGAGMAGRWSSGVNSATARFERIPPAPDRAVSLFANEAADFGASPTRVISASQISGRANLALPTTVPGVDTLTTLQLDAFLKTHPDAVLVDAVVGSTHRTLPGAYWLPELGVVTIGQLERSQIENVLRAASGGDPSRPIIVFERSSTYGWFGYHGVLRLLGMRYSNIYWYRGGLDAWHDAQFVLAQAQPWAKAR